MWVICQKCGPARTCTCGPPEWFIDAYSTSLDDFTPLPYRGPSPEYLEFCESIKQVIAQRLGPATQPTTTEEKARVREFQLQGGDYPHLQIEPIDDGPNPGEMEIDWLSINKEFS